MEKHPQILKAMQMVQQSLGAKVRQKKEQKQRLHDNQILEQDMLSIFES